MVRGARLVADGEALLAAHAEHGVAGQVQAAERRLLAAQGEAGQRVLRQQQAVLLALPDVQALLDPAHRNLAAGVAGTALLEQKLKCCAIWKSTPHLIKIALQSQPAPGVAVNTVYCSCDMPEITWPCLRR